jgi:hypothetical protein
MFRTTRVPRVFAQALAFPRLSARTTTLLLALAIVGSTPARGQDDPAVDLTVAPTREIPDGKLEDTPVADVSPQSGDYAPRIPLEVLPGLAGQAPILELVYSAKRGNGPLGAGWGLSFESAIERKSKHGGLAEMTADDTFRINGEKLVALPDGSYRTEQDDFTVYTKTELNGQLIGWTALKNGFARHYGRNTFTSLFTDVNAVEYRDETVSSGVATGQEPVRWLLSATVSPFGAEVAYRYTVPDERRGGNCRAAADRDGRSVFEQQGCFGFEPKVAVFSRVIAWRLS